MGHGCLRALKFAVLCFKGPVERSIAKPSCNVRKEGTWIRGPSRAPAAWSGLVQGTVVWSGLQGPHLCQPEAALGKMLTG